VIEPLSAREARRLLTEIVKNGRVEISPHTWSRMDERGITIQDVYLVLGGGVVGPGEIERGSWRYPIRAAGKCVVVTFRSETWTVVVTAWRTK
jgi:hypothetical protein